MTTRRSIASLATTAAAALALTSAASAFPDKLLQFVTPYPFGGSHVLHASIITTAAEPHFGQPMISVIRTGGRRCGRSRIRAQERRRRSRHVVRRPEPEL